MRSYPYRIVPRSSASSSNGTALVIDFDVVFVRTDTDPSLPALDGYLRGHLYGFDGAPGLLYQRKPDLPVSRRVGSELSVRSLLNQQLLVSRFTNLRVCAIRLSGVRLSVFGRELGFVYDVLSLIHI